MPDDTDNAVVPAWLAGGALQPVAPISSEAVAEHIAAEISGELLGMPASDNDGDPEAEQEPEASPDIEAIARQLIAFKRFWQWPAGTKNELVAAKECAELFIELMRNGDQS